MFQRVRNAIGDIFQQVDPVLLALCCAATLFGLVEIASATHYMGTLRYVLVQGGAAVIGVLAYFLMSLVDLNELSKGWKWMLLFNVVLILLLRTPLGVDDGTGNRAWLYIPHFPVSLQPAELVKLTFAVILARQLVWLQEEKKLNAVPSVAFLGAHILGLVGLYYMASGDMGSALVYIFIFACMAFAAGVKARWFALGLAGGGAAFYLLWELDKISDYMKDRFRLILDHDLDPQGVGWHQSRSLLALGSGKLTGQGLFHGTQTQSEFSWSLPARHTDFIFSAIGEELGLLGCVAALALLTAIVIRCLVVAYRARTRLESYICVAMAAMLIFQTVINVGMCLFLVPVIGLTLPFFSYGGSSLVTLFAAMGMVSGIRKRSLPEWLR
ncbi:MAG: cell division protein FtsW [Ruminococcaceae bacterium]|jgi:rod shape determining protein RodA|nr:cell division protein FtsW [Oscillospiraceae bacterium]